MPPPPKGGGFALLTARWRKAPPSGELLSAAKRRGFTPRETPPVISLCSMPDSPFCRCATSSPAPGEVIFGDGAFGMAGKLLLELQSIRFRQRLPLRGSWQNRQVLTEGIRSSAAFAKNCIFRKFVLDNRPTFRYNRARSRGKMPHELERSWPGSSVG